ncbi:tetratricopeptide repeat protein [soil metagenome]
MSRMGRQKPASLKTRWIALFLVVNLGLSAHSIHAAVADFVPDDKPEAAPALRTENQRKADALAWFLTGIFEEESDGPEKALDSKRKSLAADPTNTSLAIEVAYIYLRRGDTAEAISVLKDAIKAAPKEPTTALALSSVYLRYLHKPDLAARYAQAALDADGKTFAPYQALWDLYQSQGKSADAQKLIEKAERSKSSDPEFWLSLAELTARNFLHEAGKAPSDQEVQRISSLLLKAGDLGSKDPNVLGKIGDLYVLARQYDKAAPFYKRVSELKPSAPHINEKLAVCYIELGDTDAATKVVEGIVGANPLNIAAYDQLTKLYLKANKEEKALGAARQALIIEPASLERNRQVVELLIDLKKFDEAVTVLEEARQRFPRVGLLSYYQALALSEAKRHEEAMRVFETAQIEAANSQPELLNSDFYFNYGAAAEQAGQYVKAAELFHKSIDADPSNAARSYNYLGYMWVEQNQNLAEAEQLIGRALAMEPENGAYIDSMGWLYFKQGKYNEALNELLRASEALPEPDATVYQHVGDAYEKLGKKAEAVLYWQKSLQLDPECKEVAAKLDKNAEKVAGQNQVPKATPPPTPAP